MIRPRLRRAVIFFDRLEWKGNTKNKEIKLEIVESEWRKGQWTSKYLKEKFLVYMLKQWCCWCASLKENSFQKNTLKERPLSKSTGLKMIEFTSTFIRIKVLTQLDINKAFLVPPLCAITILLNVTQQLLCLLLYWCHWYPVKQILKKQKNFRPEKSSMC